MNEPYKLNRFYAFLLIVLGLFGFFARYIDQGDWQFTSLIPVGFGFILLALTPGMKKENKIVSHIAVVLTFVVWAMTSFMFVKGIISNGEFGRKQIIFTLIILSGIFVMVQYIAGFVARKKSENQYS